MTTQIEAEVRPPIMVQDILEAMDETWQRLEVVLPALALVLDSGPDEGGWTPRQVLSHIVGAWQRVPVHAAFFLSAPPRDEVPILLHDDYWIPEWEHAPLEAFIFAIKVAYTGNWLFVRELDRPALAARRMTPFGECTLGELLLLSYKGHIDNFHLPQLEAFLEARG